MKDQKLRLIFAILWFSAVSYPQSVKPKVSQLCSDCVLKNPASDQVVSGPYELNLKDAGASLRPSPMHQDVAKHFRRIRSARRMSAVGIVPYPSTIPACACSRTANLASV